MAFDWRNFLDGKGVEYIDRGPSTSRGNIYVACPFCNEQDGAKHMGISVEGKGWGCWKSSQHRGRPPNASSRPS